MADLDAGCRADMSSCIPKVLPVIQHRIRSFTGERTP
jgi:hypothetical protein